MDTDSDLDITYDQVFRREHGRILASLVSSFADFDLAEESLADAVEAAVRTWPQEGIPDRPGPWLLTVARRRAIERIRRSRMGPAESGPDAVDELWAPSYPEDDGYPDERLKLMFLCTHPSLPLEDRVALTLHSMAGLTTGEIASAFLVPIQTLALRLVRAKRKIREAALEYEVPSVRRIGERIEGVLNVLAFIFTEGYDASFGEDLLREGLCAEALSLVRALESLVASQMVVMNRGYRAEIKGLVALILLQGARKKARRSVSGDLVLLAGGESAQWDLEAIAEGKAFLTGAQALGKPGLYQVQASVAALHAETASGAETDWPQIVVLYRKLLQWTPGPMVMLHYSVALGHVKGAASALEHLEPLAGALEGYCHYHMVRADHLVKAKRWDEARQWYHTGLELTRNQAERRAIQGRLGQLQVTGRPGV